VKVVAVNDEIAVEGNRANSLLGMRHERAERDGQMMVVNELFAFEAQFSHAAFQNICTESPIGA